MTLSSILFNTTLVGPTYQGPAAMYAPPLNYKEEGAR
jgi:hypothetical protein